MKECMVRNLHIGRGRPKICVPIVGRTKKEILEGAENCVQQKPDLLEWRVDYFADFAQKEKVTEVLKELRHILGDCPLLFTFRTKAEGGEAEISNQEYIYLNCLAATSGQIDLIDVEWKLGKTVTGTIREVAVQNQVCTVFSNHDFHKTPKKDCMLHRLQSMQEEGADIAKIAVMPNSMTDVLRLLEATLEMKEAYAKVPLITMAMGSYGAVSRAAGEFFGSSVTFGSVGQTSAPGQIPVAKLRLLLDIFHEIQE